LQLDRDEFYHYADNVSLPDSDTYTPNEDATTRVPAAQNGRRESRVLTESTVVEFENVTINTEGE